MADPQINNAVRAQAIWQAKSGLPEDRFVTSWAFVRQAIGNINLETQLNEVAERLREFWLEPATGTFAVCDYLPKAITAQGLQIRCYALADEPPREPHVYDFETGRGATDAVFPWEVATCLSFYADRNLPRRRGRVFLGPLTLKARVELDGVVRTSDDFRADLVYSANRLAHERGIGDEMQWAVLSPTDGEIRPVTNGWVDDAFDTMRKRGQEPSVRTAFGPGTESP